MALNKKGFEFSFGWLFAMMVGAVFLFLAIYATINLVENFRFTHETETAKQIGTLLYPVETNLEEAKSAKIFVPIETKLQNRCDTKGDFGKQKISVFEKSGMGKEWRSETSVQIEVTFLNKYLFSSSEPHAIDEFNILSKPLKYPYKISDIQIVWSDQEEFCFVGLPPNSDIRKEFTELKLKNIYFNASKEDCEETHPNSKTVCFPSPSCDISVNLGSKEVFKDGEHLQFDFSFSADENALLYAAIFSDPEIYNCQIKRLMMRAGHLSDIYLKKASYYTLKGCGSDTITSLLTTYREEMETEMAKPNPDISKLNGEASDLEAKNEGLFQKCRLF